jgi:hypothetical protein
MARFDGTTASQRWMSIRLDAMGAVLVFAVSLM